MKDDNFCMVCVAYMNQQSLFLASPLLPILNGRKMGVTWDLLRTYMGGTTDSERSSCSNYFFDFSFLLFYIIFIYIILLYIIIYQLFI